MNTVESALGKAGAEAAPWIAGNWPLGNAPVEAVAAERVWPDASDIVRGGDWRPEEIRTISHPLGRVAIFGHCLASEVEVAASVTHALEQDHPASLGSLPGSYTTIVLRDERLTVLGDLASQYPMYYRQTGQQVAFASNIATFQGETASPDKLMLAAHIGLPWSDELRAGRTPLEGVRRVESGHMLHVERRGAESHRPYETFEGATVSVDQAAEGLREALLTSIRARLALPRQLSADLSGGLDSSSLAFLAARLQTKDRPQLAVTYTSPAGSTEDMQRVQQYLALPGSEGLFDHRVFRRSEIRSLYDNNLFMLPPEDTPGTATRVRSVLTEYYGFLRSLGSELHLNGEAGDAVLDLAPRYYAAELLRVGSLRKFLTTVVETSRLEYSAPYKTLAESLSARDLIPPRSLTHIAAALDQLAQGRSTGRLDPQALFAGVAAHWLTPQAGRGLAELAAGTEAGVTQGMGVGNQQAYAQIRQIGSGSQDTLRLGAAHGLRVHSPFMDNDVLRACFSVLASKRVNPWEFKPLLGKALEGLVPAEVTSRTSKGSGRRVADELRASIPFLRALLQDSYVADLGIINPKAVWRDVEMGLAGGYMPWASLDVLVSTEVWLRRLNGETGVRPKDTSARPASQKVDKMLPALKYPATTKFGLTEQSVLLAGEFSAVAMNMTSGVCFRLNSSAVKVLEALRDTEDLAGAVALLHEQHPRTDQLDIRRATEVCIARLQKAGVLGIHSAPWEITYVDESDQAEVSGERVRPPAEGNYQLQARDYLAALGGVTLGRIVKSMPFAKQARLLSRVERSAWVRHESAPHQTERTLAAVHRVISLYMGRAACVELTMATVLTEALKRRQVDFVIGLRTDPEGFHVWPEAQGIPVRTNRDPEVQGAYKTFARIGRSTTGMKR